ncbi:glutamate racemase [Marinobacter sp. BGYM27]|uniref:glutamate racemase n=1 Tax=Marinobacter sp. BGYM27 TaxID=2975597 RepID=UPI0021A4810C|nr:glutamate racemase [Marinobacter sp. BGYM27]
MNTPRILIFDSGVGGLSIAGILRQTMPGAEQIYLADTACFPYGALSEMQVNERCTSLIARAQALVNADLIVVACNTASTVVLPELRQEVQIPVVGVVPAIKPAAEMSVSRRIGILATPATVQRRYTDELIQQFAADCQVTRVGHPDLVRWAEEKVSGKAVPMDLLEEVLTPLLEVDVDTVVLGCTHYPLIKAELRNLMPDVRFWVDSGEAIARRVRHLLVEAGFTEASLESAGSNLVTAYLSGAAPDGLAAFMQELGLEAGRVYSPWP